MAGKVDNVVHRFDGRRDSQLVDAWSLLVAISGSDTQLIPACCYVCQESYAKFVGAQSLLVAMYIKKASLKASRLLCGSHTNRLSIGLG